MQLTGDEECSVIQDILFAFSLNRKEARDLYFQEFGRRVNDTAIDDEFAAMFSNAMGEGQEAFTVPLHLALAMILRPRDQGHGRQRPPKEVAAARIEKFAISGASKRWAQLIEAGVPSKQARHKAAEELQQKWGRLARVGVTTIESKMNLRKGRTLLNSQ